MPWLPVSPPAPVAAPAVRLAAVAAVVAGAVRAEASIGRLPAGARLPAPGVAAAGAVPVAGVAAAAGAAALPVVPVAAVSAEVVVPGPVAVRSLPGHSWAPGAWGLRVPRADRHPSEPPLAPPAGRGSWPGMPAVPHWRVPPPCRAWVAWPPVRPLRAWRGRWLPVAGQGLSVPLQGRLGGRLAILRPGVSRLGGRACLVAHQRPVWRRVFVRRRFYRCPSVALPLAAEGSGRTGAAGFPPTVRPGRRGPDRGRQGRRKRPAGSGYG